jgi:hypothetical protein
MPQDTIINGAADVFNNLCTPGTTDCNSDDNFWRSLSNLTINVTLPSSPPAYAPAVLDAYGPGCANSAEIWSASQADPIRRAIIDGNVVFQDYCASDNFASTEAGTSVPISRFFVATPSTPAWAMTANLARGQNLILTPGVYSLDQPIVVSPGPTSSRTSSSKTNELQYDPPSQSAWMRSPTQDGYPAFLIDVVSYREG